MSNFKQRIMHQKEIKYEELEKDIDQMEKNLSEAKNEIVTE
jgi:hypothetical protein